MKVLENNKYLLRICGIICKDERPKPTEKALKFFINFLFVVGNVYCVGFYNGTYIYHNLNNVTVAINASIPFFAVISMVGAYLGFMANESKIKFLHTELQSLVNDGK